MALLLIWIIQICFTLALLWYLFFPEKRDTIFFKVYSVWIRIKNKIFFPAVQSNKKKLLQPNGLSNSKSNYIKANLSTIAVLSIILASPSILILFTRNNITLEEYRATINLDTDTANLIASLIKGEQLAPPPPLPPDVFITAEVELVKPNLALNLANRNWDDLNPEFRQRLLTVFKIMQEKYGYHMVMIEGYRSPERQNYLANQGGHITNARAGQSYHQYGLAADSAFYRNGKLVISEKDPWAMRGYQLYGKTAQEVGLVWGGSWKTIKDLGHVELRKR
ncbi:hypothetical protein AKN87_03180 [Thiopseudomonas alkaliphila]|uniref:M15 family metallopeptidase n=1 Tax=Thiopseudomonas alkaliphila TaxID=1697053 RepID=UPI00069DEE06|nr:M15 family metallopeptidase [Thiopseudomonas alkaliphila]AKX44211.1 hypothetical protein AKN87_03180 [Thiopseudomonas alkaliphila]